MTEGDLGAVLLTGPFGVGKSAVAAEMADALECRAVEQVRASPTDGAEDLVMSNDRPVREVAGEILARLGWTSTV